MSVSLSIAIYLTMWWITLFAVLPFARGVAQPDDQTVPGADAGAPPRPRLWLAIVWTTIVSAIAFAGLYAYVQYYEAF